MTTLKRSMDLKRESERERERAKEIERERDKESYNFRQRGSGVSIWRSSHRRHVAPSTGRSKLMRIQFDIKN